MINEHKKPHELTTFVDPNRKHQCSRCGKEEAYLYDINGSYIEWPKDNNYLSHRCGHEICPECAVELFRRRSAMVDPNGKGQHI